MNGTQRPLQNDMGRYIKLIAAGAEFGPTKYPSARPMEEKGSEPATSVASSRKKSDAGMRTPPREIPKVNNAITMIALNVMLVMTFAAKYANGGIGLARFTCNQPSPRSEANPDAVPNSDAPITPNVPYVAMRYVGTRMPPMA